MLKLNDTSGDRHEIGNSINSNQLLYASVIKYIKEEDKTGERCIRLGQIKLFYERDECLLAVQFILKEYGVASNDDKDNFIYMDPKVMGPVDSYITTKNIDEITLNLAADEEIYLIKGRIERKQNKIVKLGIYTTYGQYVEFGKSTLENNFSWEYYFNLRYFDGFIIGWGETHINYLASLVIEKQPSVIDEKNILLMDTTYESRLFLIEPIFLTSRYGKIDAYTTIEDDLHKLNIYQLVKEGEVYLSEITVYYDKHINAIEVEYTNKKTAEKYKSSHIGTETKKNKDKKAVLQTTPDDCINYIKFSYENALQSLAFKTYRGKTLNCVANAEGDKKIEIFDNTSDRVMNLLGMIIGHQDKIYSIQFYYEKKMV